MFESDGTSPLTKGEMGATYMTAPKGIPIRLKRQFRWVQAKAPRRIFCHARLHMESLRCLVLKRQGKTNCRIFNEMAIPPSPIGPAPLSLTELLVCSECILTQA